MSDSLNYFVKIKKEDVYLWAPYFDAYEGMLSLRTPEPPKDGWAIFHFEVSPDFIKPFEELIKSLNLEKTNA